MSPNVVVVGAGLVGLSTAWYLQQEGAQVTVLERSHVAAGASWGNAGWVAPALTMPLNDPAILATGLRAMLSRSSPVYMPPTVDPRLISFLVRFTRNCTPGRFTAALRLFIDVNREAVGAYEHLVAAGVLARLEAAKPFIAAFLREADRQVLVEEFAHVRQAGGTVDFDLVSGQEVRALEPVLGQAVSCGALLHGQRFINPVAFTHALAASVRDRGGQIVDGVDVTSVSSSTTGIVARVADGDDVAADMVVLANGAWLGHLARPFGVRTIVQAGRGYSFWVRPESPPANPIYFPTQRVACTPLDGGLRVAGMMEFRHPDADFDERRVEVIVDAARPVLTGIDWDARSDEWVGSRPCTPDGFPLLGRTRAPNVFVAGGHGMWGIALGPLTGRLLARLVVADEESPLLRPFDALR